VGLVGEDEAAALSLAMFALVSPRGGGFEVSRTGTTGRVVVVDVGREGGGFAFPVVCCDRGRDKGTGGSEGE
jgi:hypothetical protein